MVTMEELREMDCSVLKRLMNRDESGGSGGALGLPSGGKCLLLDCRPFLAHSAGYIRGSVNVRCNTIVRRRAKGSVSLEQILPAEEEVRARLRSGLYSAVIVYDERSPRAESLRDDSTVSLVVRALRRNAERTDICLLKGPGEAVLARLSGRLQPARVLWVSVFTDANGSGLGAGSGSPARRGPAPGAESALAVFPCDPESPGQRRREVKA
nr:dual specificity protein phosphatase 4-like [Meriones unguiculatus]